MLDVPFYDSRKKTQKPLQVAVSEVKSGKMENPECILCVTCIDNCKQGVIKYSFSRRE
jgi:NAD-dependent dihydropyrimidine dehydrogenase PreA subunit